MKLLSVIGGDAGNAMLIGIWICTYVREHETCNVYLDRSRKWATENEQRVSETKSKYRGSHREEIKNIMWNIHREVDCVVC